MGKNPDRFRILNKLFSTISETAERGRSRHSQRTGKTYGKT
jgi:hypothetical protein